jgi:hypothetical protein
MIEQLGLGAVMNSFSDCHPTILGALLLTVIFLAGYLEGAVFKRRDWACVTWFWGLAALTVWIVYPLTATLICIGGFVFMSGVILMLIYYRGSKGDKK